MDLIRSLDDVRLPGAWLTIGAYDGVHRGHQAILAELVRGAHAAGLPAVVLTFDPHPAAVLRPGFALKTLTTIEERAALMGELGVDVLIAEPFNQALAELTAEEFIRRLKDRLIFSRLIVGYDFAMGKGRAGNIQVLGELGRVYGYELDVIRPVEADEAAVSSSRIRAALAAGDVESAAALLGRPYALAGEVVQGARRGRSIGIPTANIAPPPGRAVPANGVYACTARVGDREYAAAVNIGLRPTFEGGEAVPTVEAHLLDFGREIYGEQLRLAFLARLRGEQKFDGIDALVAQIRADIARTREVADANLS